MTGLTEGKNADAFRAQEHIIEETISGFPTTFRQFYRRESFTPKVELMDKLREL